MQAHPATKPVAIQKKLHRRTQSPKNAKPASMVGPGYSILKAKKEMEMLRKKFNDELLVVLEEEQAKENERERQIQQITNP